LLACLALPHSTSLPPQNNSAIFLTQRPTLSPSLPTGNNNNTHAQIHSFSSCLIVFTSATPLLPRILIQFSFQFQFQFSKRHPARLSWPPTYPAGWDDKGFDAPPLPVVNSRKFLNWPGAFTNQLRSNATLSKAPTSTPPDLNFSKSKAVNLFRAKGPFPTWASHGLATLHLAARTQEDMRSISEASCFC